MRDLITDVTGPDSGSYPIDQTRCLFIRSIAGVLDGHPILATVHAKAGESHDVDKAVLYRHDSPYSVTYDCRGTTLVYHCRLTAFELLPALSGDGGSVAAWLPDLFAPPVQPEWPKEWASNSSAIRVACVGDSITAGYLSSPGHNYPAQLQLLLGAGYKVMNFGEGGRTMLKRGYNPYWASAGYKAALASNASLLILMLGTNDAKYQNWGRFADAFPADYAEMLANFVAMPSHPQVWLMVPPPLYREGTYGMNQTVINSIFPAAKGPAAVRSLASAAALAAPIDLYSRFQAHCPVTGGTPGHPSNKTLTPCDWIARGGTDACHPNDVGYGQIATAVKEIIAP